MKITIDRKSGFCWGVTRTVDIAENVLSDAEDTGKHTYILGPIIHNPKEIARLEAKGLRTITHKDLDDIAKNDKDANIIIRAHGEPPATYKKTAELGLNIVDATCPLVTNLQNRVRKYYELGYQIVIFGKKEHAEIVGLRGVCNDECIVIKTMEEAQSIEFENKQTVFMSQTTMDKQLFHDIKDYLSEKINNLIDLGALDDKLLGRDTTCRAVTKRTDPLIDFAKSNDVMIFVSGKSSSNGKSLFHSCQEANPRSHFIEDMEELDWSWFEGAETVGISGATSTPHWYMKKVKEAIEEKFNTVEAV